MIGFRSMSNSDDEDKADRGDDSAPVAPYKVGYKKPPLHTQFKPGQSGNPSGLAKIPSNFKEMFLKELYRKVPAMENGKPVKKSQLELLAEAVVRDGITGNTKGTPFQALVLYCLQRLAAREEAEALARR